MPFPKQAFIDWLQHTSSLQPGSVQQYAEWIEEVAARFPLDHYVPERMEELYSLVRRPNPVVQNISAHELGQWRTALGWYQRFVQAQWAAESAPIQRSNIIIGLLKDQLYLAPDAFSPEEYRVKPEGATW